jgi:hypothetical protein
MDERQYLKKVMESPSTGWEKDQAQRLRRFSTRSEEILQIRRKLKELKDDLESSEDELTFKKELFSRRDDIPRFRNRYYDKSVIKDPPAGIAGRIGHYFRFRHVFSEKYKRERSIVSSLLNYILHGAPCYPSENVCAFVQDVLIWQEELREPFRRIYSAGWLDKIGADVLTPLEFNLISEMERLVNDPSIFNFLFNYRRPHVAIRRINPFLGYYLSVTRNARFKFKLYDAVRKSLKRIVYPEPRDSEKTDAILATLEKFLSDSVETRFIIPLFECAYMRDLNGESLRGLINLDPLDEVAYRADKKLGEIMEDRKRRFNETLKRNIFALEEELNFILDLKEITEAGYTLPNDKSGDFLDYLLLYYYHNRDKTILAKTSNLPVTAGDLCDIFTLAYESVLTEGIKLKINQEMRMIKLFEKSLFGPEVETIRTYRRDFIACDRKAYTPHLLLKELPDNEEAYFLKALTNVTDAFYSIGEKLFLITRGHEDSSLKDEKTGESLIGEKTMGRTRVPYSGHTAAGIDTSSVYQYTVANRRVLEVLEDIKKFAMTFAYRFEYRMRDFTGSSRAELIADKIRKLDEIILKIQGLESGRVQ